MTFLLLLAVAGLLASLIGTWILVALVAAVTSPIYVLAALWNGHGFGSAVGQVVMGIAAFQLSYSLGLLLQAMFRPRSNTPPPEIPFPAGQRRRYRVFGVWLPLIAFYDVPCQADGSPWDGKQDPNYRITILVLAWFSRALSLTVGEPWSGGARHGWSKPFSVGQRRIAPAPTNLVPRSNGQHSETEDR